MDQIGLVQIFKVTGLVCPFFLAGTFDLSISLKIFMYAEKCLMLKVNIVLCVWQCMLMVVFALTFCRTDGVQLTTSPQSSHRSRSDTKPVDS